MTKIDSCYSISLCKNPLDYDSTKTELMAQACRDLALFHYENNKDIKKLYDLKNFHPNDIKTYNDLEKIPTLGVSAMKSFLFHSAPEEKAVLKLTSSGTRGQKTQIWFDQDSLDRVQGMLDVTLEQEGLISDQLTNYVVFTYDPEDAKDLGIAYTDKNQLRFAPVKNVFYAIKKDESGEWQFKKEETLQILEKYEKENNPLRIFGMPGFIFEFLDYAKDKKKFQFSNDSVMITGGGWKAAEDKKVSRSDFRKMCSDIFGIPEKNMRDAYGMAEHSAPYFECSEHRFHVPVFNKLIIRDPISMEPLENGEKGILELITPFNTMMPTLALLSTDWAIIDKDKCPCGQNSPTFQILGRAGISKHKGCALHADDIVKRGAKNEKK